MGYCFVRGMRKTGRLVCVVVVIGWLTFIASMATVYKGMRIKSGCPETSTRRVRDLTNTNNRTHVIPNPTTRTAPDLTEMKKLPEQPNHTRAEWCAYLKRPYKINPHPYKFLISGSPICLHSAPYLLVVVPSVCNHVTTRKAIRKSWGSVVGSQMWADGQELTDIKLVFLFGRSLSRNCSRILQYENQRFGDIVVADFIDSYQNLTIKTVSALKWVATYCPNAKYILKCDEDTFPHLYRLVALTHSLGSTNTLIGHVQWVATPETAGRWKVNPIEFPFRRYPVYLQGQVYMIPGKLARPLYRLSEYFPMISVEDVFVTGILARCAGASFWLSKFGDTFGRFDFNRYSAAWKCFFHTGSHRLSVTHASPDDLKLLWSLEKNGTICNRHKHAVIKR